MNKFRSFVAAVVAIIGVIVMAAFLTATLNMDVPGLNIITDAFGYSPE